MIQTPVRVLSALIAVAVVASPAVVQAQSSQSKSSSKPAAAAKKPAAKPDQSAAINSQAAAPSATPTHLGQFGDWGAFTASPSGKKVCFVIARPSASKMSPSGRSRDPAHFFISTRPSEKVKEEVSTVLGYGLKPDSATAAIGSASFAMVAQNDGAWIRNAADEARMIDALRKGGDLVVKGTSTRGTETTDTYNLKGLAQALDRAAQECR